jgi:hypothetical protein
MSAIRAFAFGVVFVLLAGPTLRAEEPVAIVLDSYLNQDRAKGYCERALAWFKSNRSDIERARCNAITACP